MYENTLRITFADLWQGIKSIQGSKTGSDQRVEAAAGRWVLWPSLTQGATPVLAPHTTQKRRGTSSIR
jgi:hypothetical protein